MVKKTSPPAILPLHSQASVNRLESETLNMLECVGHAINITKYKEEKESTEKVSDTFFNRWRNEAQLISEAHMQYLWGKILAEEVASPNTISLSAIDMLKNIGSNEAILFKKISPYVMFGENMIMGDDHKNPLPDISVQKLQILADIGLIEYKFSYATNGKLLKTERNGTAFFSRHFKLCDNFSYR
ncbi:MAG: DUF2806 domain-containing protein [Deltaproteobacteria bacterium]|jgi:hypothetical protein|nr:DUF2806 domain-containing protein [Deltaproteobacteria bacterium]